MDIFCSIMEDDSDANVVYEDDLFKVIMDKFPANRGHILIIPKEHHVDIFDMPDEIARNIYPLAIKMAKAQKKALNVDGINVVQNNGKAANQAVFHFHLHLIPRYNDDVVRLNRPTKFETTPEEIAELCELLKKNL
ncbi:MAG: histidine triad (HIT) protein [Epulopiscium sp. Nuni2H_MBin003]|nr:MAG: histidine triad (HIT) protein [Epulopiscium sp. Nuni2H_MBin003]